MWCTNQTYEQWVQLNKGNFTQYTKWAFNDTRIVGFDPWPLRSRGVSGTPFQLGLLQMPAILRLYTALGTAIKANANADADAA